LRRSSSGESRRIGEAAALAPAPAVDEAEARRAERPTGLPSAARRYSATVRPGVESGRRVAAAFRRPSSKRRAFDGTPVEPTIARPKEAMRFIAPTRRDAALEHLQEQGRDAQSWTRSAVRRLAALSPHRGRRTSWTTSRHRCRSAEERQARIGESSSALRTRDRRPCSSRHQQAMAGTNWVHQHHRRCPPLEFQERPFSSARPKPVPARSGMRLQSGSLTGMTSAGRTGSPRGRMRGASPARFCPVSASTKNLTGRLKRLLEASLRRYGKRNSLHWFRCQPPDH